MFLTTNVFLLNFVAEAANDMIAKIEKMKESGKISKKSIYYGFEAKKGWTSFVNDHHRTMESIYQGFISKFDLFNLLFYSFLKRVCLLFRLIKNELFYGFWLQLELS